MFPLRDHNPSLKTPYVTYLLIALNVTIFVATLPISNDPSALMAFYQSWALIPAQNDAHTYITSQFLHGGFMHLAGNMLFLWIFGDNMEDEMGHLPFLGFYLAGGVAAALAQAVSDPASPIPMVGASGAIAAIMGGYLLLFPRAKIDVLIILVIFFRVIPIRAWAVLGIWFGIQIFSGASTPAGSGGVAYWAHAGGFLAGLALTLPLFLKHGGPAFWRRTDGHPPHPEAQYGFRQSTIPRAGRRR